jgi:DNA polymerase zeta
LDAGRGTNSHRSQHVYKIVVVRGKEFYGYKNGEQLFLKVFLYDPMALTRTANLLRERAVFARRFTVFEV